MVSRHADLAAALMVTCTASLALGLLSALSLIGAGLGATGSLAFGLGLAAAGCVFAAVGAVAAQLTTGAGSARGIGIITLGATFVLRGVGDVSGQAGGGLGWLSWLSPLGWGGQLRPFSGERWWVLAIAAAVVAGLAAVAVALSARRDVGAGLLQLRGGPAAAASGCARRWRWPGGCIAGRWPARRWASPWSASRLAASPGALAS